MSESSAIPGRLLRFEDAHHAACDGLVRRAGALDDALAAYRAGCDEQYRAGTLDAVATIDDWRGSYRAFATWVGEVGRGFLRADGTAALVDGRTEVDPEAVVEADEATVSRGFIDRFADDPYLGVDADVATGSGGVLAAFDQDGPPPWVERYEDGALTTAVASELLAGSARTLLGLPTSVRVTLEVDGAAFTVLRNGHVVGTATAADLAAGVVTPQGGTAAALRASRWFGRVSSTLTFLAAGLDQYSADDGRPGVERVGRAAVRGLGVLGGAAAGAWALGAAGTAACGAGGVTAPVAPVCGAVGGIIGGIAGAIFGDELVDLIPTMDAPTDDRPLAYDLDAIADVVADGATGEDAEMAEAAVDLLAREAALGSAEGADRDLLPSVMPSQGELVEAATPGPPAAPTPGTTTTVPGR